MKLIVNPQYRDIIDFILSVPEHGYDIEHVYCNRRNTVEKIQYRGRYYVVKKFRRPTITNRFIYTFIRKNKALRAYKHALELKQRGIDTATPVAYMIKYRHGLLHTAWYISEYLPGNTLRELLADMPEGENRDRLMDSYIHFTSDLHQRGICHKDYNPGNLIVTSENGSYHFALVDINRMRIGSVPGTFRSSVSFVQCDMSLSDKLRTVSRYAGIRGLSPRMCRLSVIGYEVICTIRRTIMLPIRFTIRTARSFGLKL